MARHVRAALPIASLLHKASEWFRCAEEDSDGRIVSEGWIVVDAELGEHFATSGAAGVAVKAFGSTAGVVVSGGKHGTQTVQLSSGTTFAYKVHKVSDWNKGKTQVEKVEADYKGLS